jgi:hypothetical protein
MAINEIQIVSRVSREISFSTGELVGGLLKAQKKTKEELVVAIDKYDQKIEEVARNRQDVDVNLAHTISQVCLNLLNDCWGHATDFEKHLISMACCYYLEEDDDKDGDFDSVFGFVDDAQVLNIILESIGREDFIIQI